MDLGTIRSVLNEANDSDRINIRKLDGSYLEFVIIDDIVCITKLFTPTEKRRQGLATRLMNSVKSRPVYLQAHTDGSIREGDLLAFYESLGFKHYGKGYMVLV